MCLNTCYKICFQLHSIVWAQSILCSHAHNTELVPDAGYNHHNLSLTTSFHSTAFSIKFITSNTLHGGSYSISNAYIIKPCSSSPPPTSWCAEEIPTEVLPIGKNSVGISSGFCHHHHHVGDVGFIVYETHCDGNVDDDDDLSVTLVSDDGILGKSSGFLSSSSSSCWRWWF